MIIDKHIVKLMTETTPESYNFPFCHSEDEKREEDWQNQQQGHGDSVWSSGGGCYSPDYRPCSEPDLPVVGVILWIGPLAPVTRDAMFRDTKIITTMLQCHRAPLLHPRYTAWHRDEAILSVKTLAERRTKIHHLGVLQSSVGLML